MYSGIPENMILERKYNKFLEYFDAKGVDIIGRKPSQESQKTTSGRRGHEEP